MEIWNVRADETNEFVRERLNLVLERLEHIYEDCSDDSGKAEHECADAGYRDYFRCASARVLMIKELMERLEQDYFEKASQEEMQAYNRHLYEELLPGNYEKSYADPAYAVSVLGLSVGRLFSFVYYKLTLLVGAAFDCHFDIVAIYAELLCSLYGVVLDASDVPGELAQTVYWFASDYSDVFVPMHIREMVDPSYGFLTDIIENADYSDPDLRYLYQLGEYIGEEELRLAGHMNSLPEATIETMAANYVEGFLRGFEVYRIDMTPKKTLELRYPTGMERMVAKSLKMFREHGLSVCIYRKLTTLRGRCGMYSSGPNLQVDYDHRFDEALYLDKQYKERRTEVTETALYERKELCYAYAGPMVIEGYGAPHKDFERKEANCVMTAAQQKLNVTMTNEIAEITNRYINQETRSFGIVSYPMPSIGKDFEKIFDETIALNTLDYRRYRCIQQKLIDALDRGSFVRVLGRGDNHTDITVALWNLQDPEKETIFENCLADVNIPLGEVFTSPRLTGTNGVIHVCEVYLNGLPYRNLEVEIENGMVKNYRCTNFESEEENRSYIRENVMFSHDTLPVGEFAIGTNTTAYAMAKRYGIFDRLEILIAEKTGPHFALGDTCYSYAEERKVYNPDGKEIIARSNEAARKSTYFSCHTDITIPYDELDRIEVLNAEGEPICTILENARFVLPGCEELNDALN